MKLGERVEERRQAIGISQAELARRVGISQSTMNSLINGDARTSRSLHKIARELKTSPEYLSGETDDPTSGVPDSPLASARARELLECFDSLRPDEQAALLQIARSMAAGSRGGGRR